MSHTASESGSLKQTMNNTKAIILGLNKAAQMNSSFLHLFNEIHVILYVFIHHPFLSQPLSKPGPITSLQFSLAGFGDLCHISGQCRTGKVRQSDLVLVHLTKSSHQYRRKVGLAVIVGAAEDESLPPLRVDGSGASFPRLILALLSRGVIPIDGSQHQTRRHH